MVEQGQGAARNLVVEEQRNQKRVREEEGGENCDIESFYWFTPLMVMCYLLYLIKFKLSCRYYWVDLSKTG